MLHKQPVRSSIEVLCKKIDNTHLVSTLVKDRQAAGKFG